MIPAALPLLSALIAGCIHALEMDHMTAVTTFVSRRPQPAHAFGYGFRWALGHSVALLLTGGGLIALQVRPPEGMVEMLEMGVGVMLLGLGGWVIAGARERPTTTDGTVEGIPTVPRHSHLGGTTWVGAAHGLAGTAGFLALFPATMLASPWLAAAYLGLFGVGTMLAMGIYAAGAGLLFHRIGGGAPRVARALKLGAGALSMAVGLAWLVGAA